LKEKNKNTRKKDFISCRFHFMNITQ